MCKLPVFLAACVSHDVLLMVKHGCIACPGMPISRVALFFSAGSACSQRAALYCLHAFVFDALALAGARVVLFCVVCLELADFCTEGSTKIFGGFFARRTGGLSQRSSR